MFTSSAVLTWILHRYLSPFSFHPLRIYYDTLMNWLLNKLSGWLQRKPQKDLKQHISIVSCSWKMCLSTKIFKDRTFYSQTVNISSKYLCQYSGTLMFTQQWVWDSDTENINTAQKILTLVPVSGVAAARGWSVSVPRIICGHQLHLYYL